MHMQRRARQRRNDSDAPSMRCCLDSAAGTGHRTFPRRGFMPLREIGPDGAEAVEFRVSLNVGHEERPLARVASGGELSRESWLASLKTILARLESCCRR